MASVFKRSRLDNGMTLVTESLPQFQSLALGVWVTAGTRHERPAEAGMSHFLEHMMFKGTERRSALDIARAVDRVGGEFNAFTSREYTCFHILLLARDIGLAADIMADVLLNSTFSSDEIERERKVVLQEIAMVEDNPEEYVYDLFFEQAFGGHALGKPILGDPRVVGAFDRDQVVSYFRRHYSPSQMIISVAGDVSHERARRHLNRELGRKAASRPGREGRSASRLNMSRPRVRSGTKIRRSDLEQAHLIVGFPSVTTTDRDRFAAYLLNTYLGGGMSSALFQEIREKRGLAYTVYSSLAPFSDSGLFSVYVATSPKEVRLCLEIMGREIARLRDKRLDEADVAALRENLKGTILLNSDSVENRMTANAKNQMFFGRYVPLSEVTRAIESVDARAIHAMAKRVFRRERALLTMLGPVPGSLSRRRFSFSR